MSSTAVTFNHILDSGIWIDNDIRRKLLVGLLFDESTNANDITWVPNNPMSVLLTARLAQRITSPQSNPYLATTTTQAGMTPGGYTYLGTVKDAYAAVQEDDALTKALSKAIRTARETFESTLTSA